MAETKMERTRTPGVYKRGNRYVVTFRDRNGKQRKEAAHTYDEARKIKAARTADVARGEFHAASKVTFHAYAREWVERYQGTGRRGFREDTRDDYRRDLERYAFAYFHPRLKVTDIGPVELNGFVAWLCKCDHPKDARKPADQRRKLADATVRRVYAPVRTCFATAAREGVVRTNPASGVSLPHREQIKEDDDQDVKALTRDELATFLRVAPPRHRLFFDVLAATGLRVSEIFAVQWKHLRLDGSRPVVRVRRRYRLGGFAPPKSKYARREVPLSADLVSKLRQHRSASEWHGPDDLVFPSQQGTPWDYSNARRNVLVPVAQEAGVPWAGFHTFRHTAASMLFQRGANAVQVQRWLGHHSAAFTLATYVHLLDDDLGQPLDLAAELPADQVGGLGISSPLSSSAEATP